MSPSLNVRQSSGWVKRGKWSGTPAVVDAGGSSVADPSGRSLPAKFYTDFSGGFLPDVFEPLGGGKTPAFGGNAYLQTDGATNPYNKEMQWMRPDCVTIRASGYSASEGNVLALTTKAEPYTTTFAANRTDNNFQYLVDHPNPGAGRDANGNPKFPYRAGMVSTQSARLTAGRPLVVSGSKEWVTSARMRWTQADGYWPAFWMLASGEETTPVFAWVTEYDIMEDFSPRVFGPNKVVANMFKSGTQLPYNNHKVRDLDLSVFHTWVMHHNPTGSLVTAGQSRLTLTVDGTLFFDSDFYRNLGQLDETWFYKGNMHFIFQGAQIGGTGSNPSSLVQGQPGWRDLSASAIAALPLRMEISHFGVWEAGASLTPTVAVVGHPTVSSAVTPVVSVDFVSMANNSTYISSANNTNANVPFYLEPGSSTVGVSSGALRKVGTETFHRLWAKTPIGGVGKRVRCTVVVASIVNAQTSPGSIPGLKMGPYIPDPNHPDKENPSSVANSADPNFTTASHQVFTGQTGPSTAGGTTGYIEISNQVHNSGYRFSFDNGVPSIRTGYVNGTEQTIVVEISQYSLTHVHTKLWTNGGVGAPLFEWNDTGYTIGSSRGFWRIRSDDTNWVMKSFALTEEPVSAPASTPVFTSNDAATTPALALDLNYVQSGTNYAGRGLMTGGKFRAITGPEADLGFRAHNELPTGTSASSMGAARLTYKFRIAQMGGLQEKISKTLLGFVGAASGATSQNEMSTGGIKRADAWSARSSWTPANYLAWQARYPDHPFTLCAYLYAFKAGGLEIATYNGGYGLEFLYRDAEGNFFQPVAARDYEIAITYRNNTSGLANGYYKAEIDGITYVELNDVQWNESVSRPMNYLMAQGFANDPISVAGHVDVWNVRLEAI